MSVLALLPSHSVQDVFTQTACRYLGYTGQNTENSKNSYPLASTPWQPVCTGANHCYAMHFRNCPGGIFPPLLCTNVLGNPKHSSILQPQPPNLAPYKVEPMQPTSNKVMAWGGGVWLKLAKSTGIHTASQSKPGLIWLAARILFVFHLDSRQQQDSLQTSKHC